MSPFDLTSEEYTAWQRFMDHTRGPEDGLPEERAQLRCQICHDSLGPRGLCVNGKRLYDAMPAGLRGTMVKQAEAGYE